MKIAFDENIPIAMVRVFQTFANERQLQNLVGGKFEIKSARAFSYKNKGDYPGLDWLGEIAYIWDIRR